MHYRLHHHVAVTSTHGHSVLSILSCHPEKILCASTLHLLSPLLVAWQTDKHKVPHLSKLFSITESVLVQKQTKIYSVQKAR